MAKTTLGESNGFVPSHEASKRLVTDYSRNPKKFALNEYIQIVPCSQDQGYYLEMDVETAGRVTTTDDSDILWPDGAAAPSGNTNQREFEFTLFKTKRRALPFTLGDKGVAQATFPVVAAHSTANAQNMMTRRTIQVCNMFTTVGNYDASHVIDVSTLSTGTWDQSTTARQTIKKSIMTMQEVLLDATLAAIEEADVVLVISSAKAKGIAESQEIVDYVKGSPDALAEIKGELRGQNKNSIYGLPSNLYGVKLVVEKTRRVTSRRGATRATAQALAAATPFMTARPGSLVGQYGAPSFSGGTLFVYEEMKVETFRDRKNRRTEGRTVDDYAAVLTAPAAAGMFQNA